MLTGHIGLLGRILLEDKHQAQDGDGSDEIAGHEDQPDANLLSR